MELPSTAESVGCDVWHLPSSLVLHSSVCWCSEAVSACGCCKACRNERGGLPQPESHPDSLWCVMAFWGGLTRVWHTFASGLQLFCFPVNSKMSFFKVRKEQILLSDAWSCSGQWQLTLSSCSFSALPDKEMKKTYSNCRHIFFPFGATFQS